MSPRTQTGPTQTGPTQTDQPTTITVRAAAKINLHLGVGGPRADGFHPLVTVYQAISLQDTITASLPADAQAEVELSLACASYLTPGTVPPGADNLACRAAVALAGHHGVRARARLHIDKQIPVAGGLAGGSADAAAALVALDRLWGLRTPLADLHRIAADLGSDVPFALLGGTALGTGRGEVVTPIEDPGPWWWVIVPADSGLSTPAVYAAFDRLHPGAGDPAPADRLLSALATGEPERLAAALHNDLQEAALALRPELARTLASGGAAGALAALISGSGPSCVFLAADAEHAATVAERLRAEHPVVLVASAPTAGA